MSFSKVLWIALGLLTAVACTVDSSNGTAGDAVGADTDLVVGDSTVPGDTAAGDNHQASDHDTPADTDPSDSEQPGDSTQASDLDATDSSPGDDTPAGDDNGPPEGPNVLANGSFEVWNAGLPVDWMGNTTNIPAESVSRYSAAMHDGVYACQLHNIDGGHLRFSSAPMSLAAGHYTCSYWVLGGGEIRNAFFDGEYSSYVPSDYHTIDSNSWQQITYSFNVAADIVDVFELIFSVRNTNPEMNHIVIDDVHCSRHAEPCDTVSCEAWESCDPSTMACVPNIGRCNLPTDCDEWQDCDNTNTCVLAAGRCETLADCGDTTPVCDINTHLCIAGDPCAGVTCVEWKACNPSNGACELIDGRCQTTADCNGPLPVCDAATRTCVSIDSPANIVPNGSFELWEGVSFTPGGTVYNLPTDWYHQDNDNSPPDSDMLVADVRPYTVSSHDGTTALQLAYASTSNDRRVVSEPFTVAPNVTYSCAYWYRGHGRVRHQTYCGGWSTATTGIDIDTTEWQRNTFEMTSPGAAYCVILLYASGTVADKDHLQYDEVVCSRRNP